MKCKKNTIFIFSAYWSKEKTYYGNLLELYRSEELWIKNVRITYRKLHYLLEKSVENKDELRIYEVMNWKVEEVEIIRSFRKPIKNYKK